MSEKQDSGSLNQDDIANLLNEMQSEEKTPASEKKSDTPQGDKKESSSLNQDDISKLLNEVQSEEKTPAPEEAIDSAGNIEKDDKGVQDSANDMLADDDSFEGLDSIGDDEMTDDDDEMPLGANKIAAEPVIEAKKPETKSKTKSKNNDEDKKIKRATRRSQEAVLKDVKIKPKRKGVKLTLSLIFGGVFITGLFGAYTFYIKRDANIIALEEPSPPNQIVHPVNKNIEEQPKPQISDSLIKVNTPSTSIAVKLGEITNLRKKLSIKEGEIADLIKNYENGIREMEAEILKIKRHYKINSLSGAIKNKKIGFGMMTIQRRLAYIESIKQPYEWLNQGIEELQYLKNKIEIDSQISRVISGIDMDKIVREIDVVMLEYHTGIENLEIKMNDAERITLETIWKRIIDKEIASSSINKISDAPVINKKTANNTGGIFNQVIWKEICSGNFKRKNEITTLSADAANCLSKWKHADLVLNGLSDLSPEAAKSLLKWKGNWVCLNGIKKLPLKTAKFLFQWQGNLISLNGLYEISPGILENLPQWQGNHLELMGLKYKKSKRERMGLKALAKWEASGGKLYVPVEIRKAIKSLN